jgi:hypothetical protein
MKYVNLSETKEGKNSSCISMNDTRGAGKSLAL